MKSKVNASVITCNSIKPIDQKGIVKILKKYKKIIILEEHVPHGGLSSRVKEINSDNRINANIFSFSLKDKFIHFYGSYDELLSKHGLSLDQIINKI